MNVKLYQKFYNYTMPQNAFAQTKLLRGELTCTCLYIKSCSEHFITCRGYFSVLHSLKLT